MRRCSRGSSATVCAHFMKRTTRLGWAALALLMGMGLYLVPARRRRRPTRPRHSTRARSAIPRRRRRSSCTSTRRPSCSAGPATARAAHRGPRPVRPGHGVVRDGGLDASRTRPRRRPSTFATPPVTSSSRAWQPGRPPWSSACSARRTRRPRPGRSPSRCARTRMPRRARRATRAAGRCPGRARRCPAARARRRDAIRAAGRVHADRRARLITALPGDPTRLRRATCRPPPRALPCRSGRR